MRISEVRGRVGGSVRWEGGRISDESKQGGRRKRRKRREGVERIELFLGLHLPIK